jgi:hypothetical protein
MPVVINDFEVVVESPRGAESAADGGEPAPPRTAEAPTPQEIELINRRLLERAARVHAD